MESAQCSAVAGSGRVLRSARKHGRRNFVKDTQENAVPAQAAVADHSPAAGSDGLEAASERIADLEIRLAAAEDLVETLNLALFRQQQQLDLLQGQLRHLHRQMSNAADANAAGAPRNARDEIPPHY
nr:SlyX family protein [Rhodocyclus tenuis]